MSDVKRCDKCNTIYGAKDKGAQYISVTENSKRKDQYGGQILTKNFFAELCSNCKVKI